ncbi:hypothetical protein CLV35_0792 [Motilibacter peucedani]|uniref:Putative membrane protein insertion efficiency factor n=1 Tax=Motilibacter peucedani TaxID=598650 RepID=A0A420XUF4_9ACTN|nr:membrane protein insertion efficiency factor YidD [Motilibacter peucedani]RKS80361.1 hypothetical protein CLV35_0792 [Motilibacter peucedani]
MSSPVGRALVGLVRGYQRWISPLSAPRCRFYPSCSQYAVDAISSRGPIMGTAYAVRRLLRCHPFTAGGYDPAPAPREHSRSRRRDPRPV